MLSLLSGPGIISGQRRKFTGTRLLPLLPVLCPAWLRGYARGRRRGFPAVYARTSLPRLNLFKAHEAGPPYLLREGRVRAVFFKKIEKLFAGAAVTCRAREGRNSQCDLIILFSAPLLREFCSRPPAPPPHKTARTAWKTWTWRTHPSSRFTGEPSRKANPMGTPRSGSWAIMCIRKEKSCCPTVTSA